ncbi:MAG: U32 family peptidase, partial [Chthoniobacterales bacterium]|nr:U32 family peptidase [Chthoniobacterales bacterium]
SEVLGQRSANRGECAQACRLPYGLVVDGVLRDLGGRRYLLSPQDLIAVKEVPLLLKRGVKALKIEGRMKTPEYVAAVTDVYRRVVDRCLEEMRKGEDFDGNKVLGEGDRYKLEMVFSRGLYSGWLHGVNHQELVHGWFGKKRGPLVGRVSKVGRGFVEVEEDFLCPVRPGDGVVFESGGDPENEPGGRVIGVEGRVLRFHASLELGKVREGDRIWKTDDPFLRKELRRSWKGRLSGRPDAKPVVDLEFVGRCGQFLELCGRVRDRNLDGEVSFCDEGLKARVVSGVALAEARSSKLTKEFVAGAIGKLEGTSFRLGELVWKVEGEVFLPMGELKKMRRELVEVLEREFRKSKE